MSLTDILHIIKQIYSFILLTKIHILKTSSIGAPLLLPYHHSHTYIIKQKSSSCVYLKKLFIFHRKNLRNYLKELLPKQPNLIIFHTLSCLTIGRKESLLFFKLEMFPSFQRPTVAYSTLERRLYNVIMI